MVVNQQLTLARNGFLFYAVKLFVSNMEKTVKCRSGQI